MRRIEAIAVERVSKSFGRTMALRAVSARVEGSGLFLIEGANGSGKSTLLQIVGTVLRPTSGRVIYEPFGEDRDLARRQIGWVSHETLCYGDLSGRQNIELTAQLCGVDPKVAWDAAADRFELGAFSGRPVRTNSRGQRQRIALARAMVQSPGVLLMDEPTTGLDRKSVEKLIALVHEETARGAMVVVVTHEQGLFEGVKARVTLERGRVRADV